MRFVHFDTVFENFSLCTSGGPINSFLTSFDGVLPILLLVVGFPFSNPLSFRFNYLMCVCTCLAHSNHFVLLFPSFFGCSSLSVNFI